jgi:hypothetical protein
VAAKDEFGEKQNSEKSNTVNDREKATPIFFIDFTYRFDKARH